MKNDKQEILNNVMGCHVCNYFTCKPRDFLRHTGTKRHLMKTAQHQGGHGNSPQSADEIETDNTVGEAKTTTKDGSCVKRRKRAGKRDVSKTPSVCDSKNYVCIQRQISKDEFDDFNIIEPHEFDSNLHVTSEDGVFVNLPDIDITDDDDDEDDTENVENTTDDDTIYETVYTNPGLVVDMFPNFFHRLFHTIHVLLHTTKETIMDILFEPVQT
jgi:hypothetical protein